MSRCELDAAGIEAPALRWAYLTCRRLNARHGRTYFLATRLLSPAQRPAVHALYGFARYVDDMVDVAGSDRSRRAEALDELDHELRVALSTGDSEHPVFAALAHTCDRYRISADLFHDFMRSMRMDLAVTDYPSFADLARYMHGSAEVIGLQMLPILGTVVPPTQAAPYAAALGVAFQLTNFLRDIGEDLGRGRVYLPADELAAFGVDRELLSWCRARRREDPRVRRALAHFAARTEAAYRSARPGIGMVAPGSRPCIATAYRLYRGILDVISTAGYCVVLHRRVAVGRCDRAMIAAPAFTGVLLTRVLPRRSADSGTLRPQSRGERPINAAAFAPARESTPTPRGTAMSWTTSDRWPVRRVPAARWERQPTTWHAAKPEIIDAALARATARPSGNWFVFGASSEITMARPTGRLIAGVELVAWRDVDGRLLAAPGACPHLGAPLCDAAVHNGRLLCRWHGLALGGKGFPGWQPFPAHDDGVLAWVRLDQAGGEPPSDRPVLAPRPPEGASIVSVVTMVGRCEPADIMANRLDPWHGSWFHPYAFANLRVVDAPSRADEGDDRFLVEVAFRLGRGVGVPVLAEFTCPDPRTVVMRIVAGEGTGSVVETHATPLAPDRDGGARTAVIEATVAHSTRPGFRAAFAVSPLVRRLMRSVAGRLWRDDLAYAERRYALRAEGRWPEPRA